MNDISIKKISMILIIVGVLGIFTSLLTNGGSKSEDASSQSVVLDSEPNMGMIYRAKINIPARTTIEPEMLIGEQTPLGKDESSFEIDFKLTPIAKTDIAIGEQVEREAIIYAGEQVQSNQEVDVGKIAYPIFLSSEFELMTMDVDVNDKVDILAFNARGASDTQKNFDPHSIVGNVRIVDIDVELGKKGYQGYIQLELTKEQTIMLSSMRPMARFEIVNSNKPSNDHIEALDDTDIVGHSMFEHRGSQTQLTRYY